MANYYKGTIVLYSELDNEWTFNYYSEVYKFLSDDERHSIYFTLNKLETEKKVVVEDKYLIKILDNGLKDILKKIMFKSVVIRPFKFNVVFEIVYDINSNKYAKELHSNLVFPIMSDENEKHTYVFEEEKIKSLSSSNKILCVNREYSFPLMEKAESVVFAPSLCDNNELDKYLNMFDKGLFKSKKKKDFLKILKVLYNKNLFNEKFKIREEQKEKIIREKKSVGTSLMENIEYLLLSLKSNNQELYIKYKEKYEELLKDSNLNYQVLAMLEGEIEASLLFGMSCPSDILEFLNKLKKVYLDNYLNNQKRKSELTLKQIDKINELFLKIKDKYSLLNQREVLSNLAFLYFMEVYENKDSVTLEELQDSYFADNLKSIVICIKSLQEIGLIECNYLIDLVEDLSCSVVFDMIKNIEFKQVLKENVKMIIKTLIT